MHSFAALALVLGLAAQAGTSSPAGQRFDFVVRSDFFAGFAGDDARLQKGMEACERTLAEQPQHAEAMVWHGSGLIYEAGQAFQKGDPETGGALWSKGLAEMRTAVSLAPDDVGVRIPRGAMLLQVTRFMPPERAKPLIETALDDYEHVLAIQEPYFATLGDHPKGELLFGLAEGYSRLGQPDRARAYFERLTKDAPSSGQAPKAKQWLADGTLPPQKGLGCVGCHK